jgi:N-acetylglucosaminyl-diphospho-decaprenol L-rhamnosyltransferase
MSGERRARVGAVVVHFGEVALTRVCVAALRSDPSDVDLDIVVVDNAGNLAGVELPGASVVAPATNCGYGAGVNFGVNALGVADRVALVALNNDIEVCPGFLAAAARAVSASGVGVAVGPHFLDRIAGPYWYAGGSLRVLTGTVHHETSANAARRARPITFVNGAAFAINPEAWSAVGGFDPSYFLYNEDLDLSLRLRRRGFELRFEPAMQVVHHVGSATGSRQRSPLYLEHLSANRLRPFPSVLYRLYLAALHSAYVFLRAGWHLLWVGGASGRAGAKALVRGHLRALSRVMEDPRM